MKSKKSVEIVAGILTAVISGLMTWAVFSGVSCVICWLVGWKFSLRISTAVWMGCCLVRWMLND